ncbi:MAG: alkaline phosphatase family protein [Nanohaloarchaea archaeon]|nr:alkaline phosphatase family protein [Candidatus Nanohaloarchaea archaeon]
MEKVFPKYGEASLADIPGTVLSLFNIESDLTRLDEDIVNSEEDYENVVVILIDGLGLNQLENFSRGFFEEAKQSGELKGITSVFPSATPATLTSINTGKTPKEHGLLGWEMYYEEIDSNIFTLPFLTTEGEKPQDAFEEVDPKMLFEGEPIYPRLEQNDVNCFSVTKEDIVDSEYTEMVKKGSEIVPYLNTADMALQIRRTLEENEGKKYIYAYTSDIDSISHMRGPKTEDERNQLEMISETLNRNLVEEMDEETAEDTLVLITADHGQIEHDEKVDLFQWDNVGESLKTDDNGDLITPTGNGGRSIFLHVKEEKLDELHSFLNEKLDAEVMKTETALEEGYFGEGELADNFKARAGELVIVSNDNKIHWGEPWNLEDIGVHGGLHQEEMKIPLLKFELSDLRR